MSLKFIDGFDQYAPVGTKGAVLTPYLSKNGYTVTNASDTTFEVVAGRASGARALQFTVARNSSVNASLSWGFSYSSNYACFGFAMRASGSRMRIARIENIVDIDWDATTGKISVGGQLGVNPLILNAWYYFEIEVDFVNNAIRIWANNELQLTVTTTVSPPARLTVVWGQVGTAPEAGVQVLDDFYVIDGAGARNNARLSPLEIVSRMPTADIQAEWEVVGADAGTPHYQIVSQLLPEAANAPYVQSNTAGATDLFRSNAALPNNNQIFGISVIAYARKGDVDNRQLGLLIKPESGAETEALVTLTETFAYYQATYETAPGGGDWNQNIVESLQFGFRTR